ncbi:MAG TPA: flavin reductase family protein [Mycobacteriales bacterium]|nr:flavin reductase family protein [Mycobacteriales bacterium]
MSIDADAFRGALAHVPMPVAVVTALDSGGEPHGMTIGSLCSLSVAPPLVLFCVDRGAAAHGVLCRAERYCLSVLGAGQEEVARRFAHRAPDRFAAQVVGLDGLPAIDGALMWLSCDRHQVLDGGDHSIIVARVDSVRVGPGRPLVYHDRGYGTIAARLAPAAAVDVPGPESAPVSSARPGRPGSLAARR